ncbi:uncharacterized protein LOC131996030 [Stomoxys calcitrans]|uniref:uncharacterized protein LOC131996030 n=1 Tax=Stomoxys calcitrans TaxID=35570 RepID=UPI0027E21EA0|nr:uncharacterized protein LOC131996030 [Stomoxys calcitrans]
MSITIRFFQLPIKNAQIRVILGSCSETRVPALNQSWDACAFMKDRKTNRALGRLYQYIEPYTNINHTCPYNHDIHIANFTLSGQRPMLPVFNGEYFARIEASIDGKKRLSIDVISDYKL